ncbi:MAG: type II toxin-antitoxin system VapC family toxin [Vicinamibacteria bacterium]
MKWLLDTNVLSELTKAIPDPAVEQWLRREGDQSAIDPIVIGELKFGILLLPKGARRKRLEQWFDDGASKMQCLPWDRDTGLEWAALLARLRSKGLSMPLRDSMIAATGLVHKLTVVTRNTRDFKSTGVALLNPFA